MGTPIRDILFFKEVNIDFFRGKTLAVDAYNIIYQFLTTIIQFDGTPLKDKQGNITSHLSGLFYRNANLISKGINLVYVFDGRPLEYKEEENEHRRELRQEAENKREEFLKQGNFEEARKFAKQAYHITSRVVDESKKLLDLMGIPWIEAPAEGEVQAAQLVKEGKAFAVVTQDYDALVVGCPRVVRNLNKSNQKSLELFELEIILKSLEITQEQLVEIALLVGTDYNRGIKNIGPKTALKIVKENKFYNVWCDYYTNNLESKDKDEAIKQARKEADLLKSLFLGPVVNKNVEIPNAKGNKEKLKEYLLSRGFSEARISPTIEKIFPSQKTLF